MKAKCGYWMALGWLLLAAGCSRPTSDQLLAEARQSMTTGDAHAAQVYLENLLDADPNNAAAVALLGRVSLASGNFGEAQTRLRKALQLGVDPASVQVPLLEALISDRKFEAVLAQVQSGPELTGEDKIEELRIAGAAQRALGEPKKAETLYRQALAMSPESVDVRGDLAAALLESGQLGEAAQQVAKVLSENPNFALALLLRGRIEHVSGRYADAEATYADILERTDLKGTSTYSTALSWLVDVLVADKKYAEALSRADALIALAPENVGARTQKAEVEIAQGHLDDAEHLLQTVLTQTPSYGRANRLLAKISLQRNQPLLAQTYLRAALTDDPDDKVASLQLAQVYLQQGDAEGAKTLLKQSLPSVADDPLMFALAGAASLQSGETELADQYFEESAQGRPLTTAKDLLSVSSVYIAAGQFERAVRAVDEAQLKDADGPSIKTYLLALIQVRQQDFAAAEATARDAAARWPNSAWPIDLEASIRMLQGDYKGARAKYAAALSVEPDNIPALLNLARVNLKLGDAGGAKDALRRAVGVDPKQPTAILGLAELALKENNLKEAATWLERAPPDAPGTLRLQGQLAMARAQFEKAAGLFATVFARQPSATVAIRAYEAQKRAGLPRPDKQLQEWVRGHPDDIPVNLVLGALAMGQNDDDTAIRHFEAVVDADPHQAAALNNLAWLYGRRGDERALEVAEAAYRAAPDNPAIADTLGWLRVQHGAAAAGLSLLERSRKALPASSEVKYHWAVALACAGQTDRATSALHELSTGRQAFPARADAERLLHEIRQAPEKLRICEPGGAVGALADESPSTVEHR